MRELFSEIVGVPYVLDGDGLSVDGMHPTVVLEPGSVEEVAKIMQVATANQWAITPVGAGGSLGVGNPPSRVDVILSLKRLSKIMSHEPGDLTTVVEAGCTLGDLNKHLNDSRQCLPLDPPGGGAATIGGIAALGVAGAMRQGYGAPRDWVLGLKIVSADGRILEIGGRVVKNVAGYDLSKLHVGGLGTLGVIVSVNLKVFPRPETELTVAINGPERGALLGCAGELVKKALNPTSLELMSITALNRCGLELHGRQSYLLARYAGTETDVRSQAIETEKIALAADLDVDTQVGREFVVKFWHARAKLMTSPDFPLILHARVKPTDLESVISCFVNSLGQFCDEAVIAASAGIGTAILTAEGWRVSANIDAVVKGIESVRQECASCGGSLVVWSAPFEIKGLMDVWGDIGAAAGLMKQLKSSYDSQNLLNPGRFAGGI
ncbi:MAG: FAD-binding oxidoreductase [Candidatus Latescibacteria bacterium]|nr:FAD-binding oxidoreductase [Candidatus Latescibacterota bacterium]